MKKILTSLFALAAVFCASAEVPTYSVSPADGSTVESRHNLKVIFTFDEAVKAESVQYSGGGRSNRTLTTTPFSMSAPSKTITVVVPDSVWGQSYCGEFLLSVTLADISDKDGQPIQTVEKDADGNDVYQDFVASSFYVCPDTTPAQYDGVDPNPSYTSAWDAYFDGWGVVDFGFTNTVSLTGNDAGAEIEFVIDGDPVVENLSVDELDMNWNSWTGTYMVSVLLPYMEDIESEEDLDSITISLKGVKSNDMDVEVPSVTYTSLNNPNIRKAPNTASISLPSVNSSFTVYNVDGSMAMGKANVNDLKTLNKGLYIINGKKVIIR